MSINMYMYVHIHIIFKIYIHVSECLCVSVCHLGMEHVEFVGQVVRVGPLPLQ